MTFKTSIVTTKFIGSFPDATSQGRTFLCPAYSLQQHDHRPSDRKSSMKSLRIPILLLGICSTAAAFAQFRKPEDSIRYRQGVMEVMDFHLYRQVASMINGRIPFDAKAAARSAGLVATMSSLPWPAFLPGTDSGKSDKTDAKPAIWSEPAKFKDLGEKMQAQVVKLQAAAEAGDLESLKIAYRATSNACKACHDAFTSQ
jgi:cytochrome c556